MKIPLHLNHLARQSPLPHEAMATFDLHHEMQVLAKGKGFRQSRTGKRKEQGKQQPLYLEKMTAILHKVE